MNWDRKMGFGWGFAAGACVAAGAFYRAEMVLLTMIPLLGVWFFRDVH